MRIVAFLQNQWFKDPEGIKALFDEHPERRQRYIAAFLFMGCLTGRRLQLILGEELCDKIIWEETSTQIGGQSSSRFPPDHDHILQVVIRFQPKVILCFGSIASKAIPEALMALPYGHLDYTVLHAPHPAIRKGWMVGLVQLRNQLEEIVKNANNESQTTSTPA
jgi:hypothetical protein